MLVGGQTKKSEPLAVTSVVLLAYFRGVRSQGGKADERDGRPGVGLAIRGALSLSLDRSGVRKAVGIGVRAFADASGQTENRHDSDRHRWLDLRVLAGRILSRQPRAETRTRICQPPTHLDRD